MQERAASTCDTERAAASQSEAATGLQRMPSTSMPQATLCD